MSGEEPENWAVERRDLRTLDDGEGGYYIFMYDKIDSDKQVSFWIDELVDTTGASLSIEEAGNLWKNRLGGENRTYDSSNPGYYSFEYTSGKYTLYFVLYDRTKDSRLLSSQYFAYVYANTVEDTEVKNIINSVLINGSKP